MIVLVAYDVATSENGGAKRLRRVARACSDYGTRVQKSVFECQLGRKDWIELRSRLLEEADLRTDSLRFYFLDTLTMAKTEHHGINEPVDFAEPFVL